MYQIRFVTRKKLSKSVTLLYLQKDTLILLYICHHLGCCLKKVNCQILKQILSLAQPFNEMESRRRSYKGQMSRLREYNQILQNGIKPDAILPPRLQVPSAGTHFYMYGLFFFRDPKIKRKFYYNPFFIFFMEFLYLSRSLVSLHVPNSDRQYFVYLGDYMYFIRAKTHINIAATQYMSLGMCILIMNLLNYRMGVEPAFLKSIAFLRGQCTPASCGLHNSKYILNFIRQAKYSLKITDFNTKAVFVVSFLLSFLPTVLNFTFFEMLAFGIPWSTVFAISSYFTFSSYFWNLTYFFIVCHYIKYRIRQTNDTATRLQKLSPIWQKWQMKLVERDLISTSCMVDQWSGTYWSKYLAIAITLLSTFNNTVFYTALFVDMNIVVSDFQMRECFNL